VHKTVRAQAKRRDRPSQRRTFSYTDEATKVIAFAEDEARNRGQQLGSGHLLLGLIGGNTGIAAKVLKRQGITVEEARVEVKKIIGRNRSPYDENVVPTDRAQRVLNNADKIALILGGLLSRCSQVISCDNTRCARVLLCLQLCNIVPDVAQATKPRILLLLDCRPLLCCKQNFM
jgi:hypothetical protein